MLNLPNTISIGEVATLLGADILWVRQRIEDHQIVGIVGGSKVRRTFKIPRIAFYKSIGWETDEEIRHGYKMAGLKLVEQKQKADADTSTKN